ncbi:hypothetical protein [Rummeliibacillus stabekisii]|uniref:Uncharacterized protein n=1 Tax=Rummeliibacillus stabekisii TaxID=241244 RepID=A0A143HCK5_9BACL|nr:hypothetical protein [Rummeliibacillus stabekisii]AMW99206.1 hypothetical protein ATY39_06850 [Rummeliibacillus stabekisii]
MIAVKAVNDILCANENVTSLVPDDKIYMIDIPAVDQKIENAPLLRINEIYDYAESFSSNKVFSEVYQVQIAVWAKTIEELEPYKKLLDQAMAAENWSCYYRFPLTKDEDIDLYMLARRYVRQIVEKEEEQ